MTCPLEGRDPCCRQREKFEIREDIARASGSNSLTHRETSQSARVLLYLLSLHLSTRKPAAPRFSRESRCRGEALTHTHQHHRLAPVRRRRRRRSPGWGVVAAAAASTTATTCSTAAGSGGRRGGGVTDGLVAGTRTIRDPVSEGGAAAAAAAGVMNGSIVLLPGTPDLLRRQGINLESAFDLQSSWRRR